MSAFIKSDSAAGAARLDESNGAVKDDEDDTTILETEPIFDFLLEELVWFIAKTLAPPAGLPFGALVVASVSDKADWKKEVEDAECTSGDTWSASLRCPPEVVVGFRVFG